MASRQCLWSDGWQTILVRAALFALLIWLVETPGVAAELRAAAIAIDITPPVGGRMYGYGARGDAVSQGVHDRLYAKVLVLSDGETEAALVSLDLGSIRKAQTRRIRTLVEESLGWGAVLLSASHSHSTPTFDDPHHEAWLTATEKQVAEAIVEAAGRLRPARLAVGEGKVRECHNRRHVLPDRSVEMRWGNRGRLATEPVDETVLVLAINDTSGEPLATVVNYPCHPVVLGPLNLEISADWPGAMQAAIEGEIGGVAMFLQGAAGDINPFWDKTAPTDGAFLQVERLGRAVAREVLTVRERLEFADPGSLAAERREISMSARWSYDDPAVVAAYERVGAERLLAYYAARFEREQQAEVMALVLGSRQAPVQVGVVSFPGEFFVEFGQRLRRESLMPTLFVGYANGELGYFPTLAAAAEGGYGAKEGTVVEVGAGDRLLALGFRLLHELGGWFEAVPDLD